MSYLALLLAAVTAVSAAAQSPASADVPPPSQLTNPTNGAQNVDTTQPFTWTSVNGAQAYYLYVSTTQGGRDLINSGEIQSTSYNVGALPVGQTLWARIYTEIAGHWYHTADASFTAAPGPVQFAYPTNGAQLVDTSKAFSWKGVAGAQSYDVQVGTTQGASDLFDSGAITTTSVNVGSLPSGRTLWARLTTSYGSTSRSSDISFTALPPLATFTDPTAGAQNVDTTQPFTWTSVNGAQAYYLYVSTTQGGRDLINSGEIQSTSYNVGALPVGQTLWARIYTKLNGSFYPSSDVTFTAAPSPVVFAYPTNGAQLVDTSKAFSWKGVAGAQSYDVQVGTTQGASDLFDSGAITTTSVNVGSLPSGRTLWARLTTSYGSTSRSSDISFTALPPLATFTDPTADAQNVDTTQPFTWTSVNGAQAYYLYVSTTQGGRDLINSGEIQSTSYNVGALPVGQTLWARIYTKLNQAWYPSPDVTFTAAEAPVVLTDGQLTSPESGTTGFDPSSPFAWQAAAVINAAAPVYDLTVGRSPAASDLFDSGPLTDNQINVPASALPADGPLYARVVTTLGDGSQLVNDGVFSVAGAAITGAALVYPQSGDGNVDVSRPFQWQQQPLATRYRLQIFDGSNIVRDSGWVNVTQRYEETLPVGDYTAHLKTDIDGTLYEAVNSFHVSGGGVSSSNELGTAQAAVDWVRSMADLQNHPLTWTPLFAATRQAHAQLASCGIYTQVLLSVLSQTNLSAVHTSGQQPMLLSIAFSPNGFDTHTLVEFFDVSSGRWILLDPTFDLAVKRTSDGSWASADDVSIAARSNDLTAITFVFLGAFGDAIARSYYLDYPLLFLNDPASSQPPADITPYLQQVPPPQDQPGLYLVSCGGQASVVVKVDGADRSLTCGPTGAYSQAFFAATISASSAGGSTASTGGSTPSEPQVFVPIRQRF